MRDAQRLLHGKPTGKALVERPRGNSELSAPLGDGLRLAVDFNVPANATVPHLLCAGGPAAVLRAIVAIVVLPVQGVPRCWGLAHIGSERLEAFCPPFADLDPAPAVVGEACAGGVEASALHLQPNAVQPRSGPSMRLHRCAHRLRLKTATGLRVATAQLIAAHHSFIATIANTSPACLAFPLNSMAGKNKQATMRLSRHVNEFRHRNSIKVGGDFNRNTNPSS